MKLYRNKMVARKEHDSEKPLGSWKAWRWWGKPKEMGWEIHWEYWLDGNLV